MEHGTVIAPGVTPANGDAEDMVLDIVTPSGEIVSIDDPELIKLLGEGINEKNQLKLVRSDRALTDCRPVSLISLHIDYSSDRSSGIKHADWRSFSSKHHYLNVRV